MTLHSTVSADFRATPADPDLFRGAALIGETQLARDDMAVADPATGATLGIMPDCTVEQTRAAIAAAETAMIAWRARTNADRADLLMACTT